MGVSRETPDQDPVSRETTPPAATLLFPADRLNLAEQFADLLATAGVERGLIGPREAPRLWDRHLLNCAMLAEAIPADSGVVDLGSGAGLPGLVLAIARPDTLGRRGVDVVRGRAEALHGQRTFDVVTSRALAPLTRLVPWSMPLVSAHGVLLAMKGSSLEEEIVSASAALERFGCAPPEILELGVEVVSTAAPGETLSPTRAVRVAHADPSQVAWRVGVGRGVGTESRARRPQGSTQRSARRRHSG
jgi:16S rRNA (guanine527-N7)-methyltransferase